MLIEEKAVADITDAGEDFGPNGGFEAILSAPTLDRDGDVFATNEWKTPLPDKITVDVDHEMSVAGTIGSANPYIADDGTLRIRATFASTVKAQEVRTLIQEGHIDSVSVACMTDKALKKAGEPCRELLNAGVVSVPSNREAKILAAKAKPAEDTKAGARNSKSDAKWLQAAHDATIMAGAQCVPDAVDGDGEEDGANKAVQPMVINAKSVTGSLEDLQSTLGSALDSAYANSGASFSYLVATFLSGDGGTIVYRLYPQGDGPAQTLSRQFTRATDGSVTLGTEVEEVELVTTTEIAEKSADKVEKSADATLTQPVLTPEQFERLLAQVGQTSTPTGGEPHNEATPAESPADVPAESPAQAADGAATNAAGNAAGAESDVAGELPQNLRDMAQTALSRLE